MPLPEPSSLPLKRVLVFEVGAPDVRDHMDLRRPFPRGEKTVAYFHLSAVESDLDRRLPDITVPKDEVDACMKTIAQLLDTNGDRIASSLCGAWKATSDVTYGLH